MLLSKPSMTALARLALLYLALATSACVHVRLNPQSKTRVEEPPRAILPRAVLVRGTERFKATVSALGIPVALASGSLEPDCQAPRGVSERLRRRGKRSDGLIRMRTSAWAGPLVAWLSRAGANMETWIDPKTGVPFFNEAIQRTPGGRADSRLWFDGSHAQGGFTYLTAHTGDPLHDHHTATLLLRHWRPRVGARGYFHLVASSLLFRLDVTYHGSDVLLLDTGPRRSVRITGTFRQPGAKGLPQEFTLWVSDDSESIPLRLITDSAFGLIRLDVDSYTLEPSNCDPAPAALPVP